MGAAARLCRLPGVLAAHGECTNRGIGGRGSPGVRLHRSSIKVAPTVVAGDDNFFGNWPTNVLAKQTTCRRSRNDISDLDASCGCLVAQRSDLGAIQAYPWLGISLERNAA